MATAQYNLNSFNEIAFSNMEYKLPSIVITAIDALKVLLGVSTMSTSETQSRRSSENVSRDRDFKKKKFGVNKDTEWETIRSFKTTIIEKKEGVEKTMSDIRNCLNKISIKNYEANKEMIMNYIDSLCKKDSEETGENIGETKDLEKIANNIFDIASTNKFFSEIYAKLYGELAGKYTIFKDILSNFLCNFTENMKNIKYVDPAGNYDAFCIYNKANDARKATSVFIVNLVKEGIIESSTLLTTITDTYNIILKYIYEENRINEVEEIIENLYLLVTETIKQRSILTTAVWDSILQNIKTVSELKVKDVPSISSRAIFKMMDILDKMKNVKN